MLISCHLINAPTDMFTKQTNTYCGFTYSPITTSWVIVCYMLIYQLNLIWLSHAREKTMIHTVFSYTNKMLLKLKGNLMLPKLNRNKWNINYRKDDFSYFNSDSSSRCSRKNRPYCLLSSVGGSRGVVNS